MSTLPPINLCAPAAITPLQGPCIGVMPTPLPMSPVVPAPSRWRTSSEMQGNILQSIPCPKKVTTSCIRMKIIDAGSNKNEPFDLNVTMGCNTHAVRVCNPYLYYDKSCASSAQVSQYWQDAFHRDSNLISAGVFATVISTGATAAGYEVELQFCPSESGCQVSIAVVTKPALANVSIAAYASATTGFAKPGEFCSYDPTGTSLQIVPYNPALPYAGYYELPPTMRSLSSAGGNFGDIRGNTMQKTGGCGGTTKCCAPSDCQCSSCQCCAIRVTGPAIVKLSKPVTKEALIHGQPLLVQAADGSISLEAGNFAVPAGSAAVMVPYSLLMNERTIGSSVIQIALH